MDSRKPSCSRSEELEIRKGPWTMEEDLILINYIATHGEGVWNSLAKAAGLKRTGKSCRLRWLNYLRPDVRRGNITPEEQILIMDLHAKWGNRWSKIAKHLPGRTDNEIKNFWRTRIQKQLKQGNMNEQSSPGQSYEQAGQSTSQVSSSCTTGLSLAAAHDPYSASSYAEPMSSGYHMLPPHNNGHGHAPVPALPSHHQMGVADSTDHYWPMEADLWNSMAFFSGDQGRLT